MINKDGSRYEGLFTNNKKSGFGVEILKDGSKFEGEFVNGIKTG